MDDMLNFLQEKGIINLDDVREMMEQERKNTIISQHKYAIFQDKRDGRWKTTVEDATTKRGTKVIAKKNRRDLEEYLLDYLLKGNVNVEGLTDRITLRDMYLPWLQSRKLEVKSINTVKRNAQDWKNYYDNDYIVDKPLSFMNKQELKDWAHQKIRDNEFSRKQYYNMIVIMNKLWQFAVDSGYIEKNIWKEVKINSKLLKKNPKKSNETQVYFLDEKTKLVSYCLSMFNKNPKNIVALSIPLMFLTGMRIGEVAALKYEDCVGDEILIRRSEVIDYDMHEDGTFHYVGPKVEDHAKTEAGERSIPFTMGARQIINLIKSSSDKYGFYDEGYIFCPNSKRVKSSTIDIKIYDYCEKLGIPKKSAHKIRKTFISQMIIAGMDIDTVCRVSGHTDITTTFNSYTYSLTKKEDRLEEFQNMCSDLNEVLNGVC